MIILWLTCHVRGRVRSVRGTCRALLLLCLPFTAVCGSPSAPDDPVESNVTVMTYNIFHDGETQSHGVLPWLERRDAVVETIRTSAPDLIGLQEAEQWQVAWLLEQLPEYDAVARPLSADGEAAGVETVGILYRTELFELQESGHFWYSSSPDQPGSYGAEAFGMLDGPRMATWVHLLMGEPEASNRRGVYLFNTHFVADAGAEDPELARFRSAELLASRITARAYPDDFFFLTGDLNATAGEPPLTYLLGSRCQPLSCPDPEPAPDFRMIDAWASLHPGDVTSGTRCNGVTGDDGPRIDYVLAWAPASPAVVSAAEIIDPGSMCPSDHRAVVATFLLPVSTP